MRRGYGPAFTIHIAKEGQDSLFRKTIPYSGQEVVAFSKELSEMADGVKVIGAQAAAIVSPAGGTVIDVQARAAIAAVLGAMRGHGLIAG